MVRQVLIHRASLIHKLCKKLLSSSHFCPVLILELSELIFISSRRAEREEIHTLIENCYFIMRPIGESNSGGILSLALWQFRAFTNHKVFPACSNFR